MIRRAMLLLTVSMVLFATTATAQDIQTTREINAPGKRTEDTNLRLPNTTKPSYYKVKLIPYLVDGNYTFDGETNITFNVLEPTNKIVLHTKNLTIDESTTRLKFFTSGKLIEPTEHKYNNVSDFLTLSFQSPLVVGTYELIFKFTGELGIDPSGFYRSSYVNENNNNTVWVAATHFQPYHARRAFPCWDEPALKAQFDIIIKHDLKYTALSNMPVKEQSAVDEYGMLSTSFQTTPNMSTYVVAFAVVDYNHISNANGLIKVWAPKETLDYAGYILNVSEEAIKVMEEYTKRSVGVPKMDNVVIPRTAAKSMENWGLMLHRKNAIQYDPLSIGSKEVIQREMIHQLALMWFGNLVSPSYWNYLWMIESFGMYFSYTMADKIFPNWRILDTFGTVYMRYIFEADAISSLPLNYNVFSHNMGAMKNFYYILYYKSSAILRMAEHAVSEEVFHNGTLKYINKNAYNSVTPDDLSEALQEALDESAVPHEQFTVKEFIDTWANQGGHPIVIVTRNYTTGETQLTQKCQSNDTCSAKWLIPISYAIQSNPDFSQTAPKVWMRPQDNVTKIEGVDKDEWIILNVQQTGVYGVNYDEINWQRIADCLNSDNFTKIHVVNRANIISSVNSLMHTSDINPKTYFKIISYLERETDATVWEMSADMINRLYPFIMAPEQKSIFHPRILRLINNILEHLGIEDKPDDDQRLSHIRPNIRMIACRYGHSKCTIPHDTIPDYIAGLKALKYTRVRQYATVCAALREAGDAAWQQVFNSYIKDGRTTDLICLACTNNATLFENFLDLVRARNSPFKGRKIMSCIHSTLELNPANADIAVDYWIKNKEQFKDIIDASVFQWPIYRTEQFQKMRANFPLNTTEDEEVLNKEEAQIRRWENDFSEIGIWLQL